MLKNSDLWTFQTEIFFDSVIELTSRCALHLSLLLFSLFPLVFLNIKDMMLFIIYMVKNVTL